MSLKLYGLYQSSSFLNSTFRLLLRMSNNVIERIKQNAQLAETTIAELKNEINALNAEYNKIRIVKLTEENKLLEQAVEEAKKKLIELEIRNGIVQIPVPTRTVQVLETPNETMLQAEEKSMTKVKDDVSNTSKEKPPKKEKKPKEGKEKPPAQPEAPIDFGRLDLRVAKVEDVQRHPDADTLYLLKINCGEEKPRTVCSGLVKHVPIEDLKDINVVLLCNLKPVKMRGITSEAMVMCASSPEGVEVLIPPPDCLPGDPVECEGYIRQPDPVMNPKKKIFETVAPDLHTNDSLQACYKDKPWNVPGKGHIFAKTLKNVSVK